MSSDPDFVVSHQRISFAPGRATVTRAHPEADIGAGVVALATIVILLAALRGRARIRVLGWAAVVLVLAGSLLLSRVETIVTLDGVAGELRSATGIGRWTLSDRRVAVGEVSFVTRRVMVGEWPGQQEVWVEARVRGEAPLLLVRLRGGGWEDEKLGTELIERFEETLRPPR